MRGLIARVRSLWRGIRCAADVESEMAEEFRLHVALRAEDLVASGLSPAEAVRQARVELGGVERYREEGRRSRGLHYYGRDDNAPTVTGNSAIGDFAAHTAGNAPTTTPAATRVRT